MNEKIRNFCIIAHIDHGKSTLADRMLEITETIKKWDKSQVLDRMDLEQERGITIKLTPARMQWKWCELNLIDTPGHVDFQYEVSRSLAAVEWAVLLVDASQWIQAQTLSTLYMAIEQWLEIIPVLNKIDLPAADPDRVAQEIENVIWIDKDEIICVSGKTGQNVELVLDAIIERIKSPNEFKKMNKNNFYKKDYNEELWEKILARALIFDSVYDPYKWVLAYVKMIDGNMQIGSNLELIYSKKKIIPTEVGYFNPDYKSDKKLTEGQIGYIVTWQKSVRDVHIGDTMLLSTIKHIGEELFSLAVPGFKKAKPFVYAGVYPIDTGEYDKLKDSLEKLSINDSAIQYELEDSKALGLWFRCGFLWMLHMDIIKERLSREYGIETIFTTPTVVYLIKSKQVSIDLIKSGNNIQELIKTWYYKHILSYEWIGDKEYFGLSVEALNEKYGKILESWIVVRSGWDMIPQWMCEVILEPVSEVEIVGPKEFSGEIMTLCQEYRWNMVHMDYLDETRIVWRYNMPMGEIIVDFYDKLKSGTKWFATMNYDFKNYIASNLLKLDIFINNEVVEALSRIVHKDKAYYFGKQITEKLKELIPRHLFPIPIQAGIWTKMIARETIPAVRKDVLAKCYGWDVSRKKKLLAKQKEGKKKMKAMGNVNVPGDVFIKLMWRS